MWLDFYFYLWKYWVPDLTFHQKQLFIKLDTITRQLRLSIHQQQAHGCDPWKNENTEESAMIPSGFCLGSLFYQCSWSPSTAAVSLSRESKYWIIGYWWSRNLQHKFLKRKNCLGEGNLCGFHYTCLTKVRPSHAKSSTLAGIEKISCYRAGRWMRR